MYVFLFGFTSGEVYRLELNPACGKQQRWQQFTASKHARAHNRIVFNAVSAGVNTLCTTGMDRQIIVWDAETCRARCSLSTLGGFTYCVAQSAINPGKFTLPPQSTLSS